MTGKQTPIESRIWDRIAKTDSCWIWTGGLDSKGYGRVTESLPDGKRKWHGVHRVVYELIKGPIPEGMVLDHVKEVCGNTACCNPDHLEPVTQRENLARSE